MKKIFIFTTCILIASIQARAQSTGPVAQDELHREQAVRDGTEDKRLQDWLQIHQDTGTWPVEPGAMTNAKSESEFLRQIKENRAAMSLEATGSGNGGGPLGLDFLQQAKTGFIACGADADLTRSQSAKLNVDLYKTQIFAVNFNLCPHADVGCSFQDSFTAKNYPDSLLILVNVLKWNELGASQRLEIAIHEFLGIVGAEQGTYGTSSRYHLVTQSSRLAGGFSEVTYCVKTR